MNVPAESRFLAVVVLSFVLAAIGFGPEQATGEDPARRPAKDGEQPAGLSQYLATTDAEIQKVHEECSRLPTRTFEAFLACTRRFGGR